MTPQISNKAALTIPVDPATDQVTKTRRVLREMNDKADAAIDAQAAASNSEEVAATAHLYRCCIAAKWSQLGV